MTGCRGGILELRSIPGGRPLRRLLDQPGGGVVDARFLTGHGAPVAVATYRDAAGAGHVAIWHADSGAEIPIEPPPPPGPVSMLATGALAGPIVCALRGDAVDIIHISGRHARADRWPLPMAPTVASLCGGRLFVGGAGGFIGIDIS